MGKDMPDFSNVKGGSSSTATRIYEVVSGDSLSRIAKREYGNANDWKRIFEANRERAAAIDADWSAKPKGPEASRMLLKMLRSVSAEEAPQVVVEMINMRLRKPHKKAEPAGP